MLNGKEWQHTHPEFYDESHVLLNTCQECLTHLALISDDQDAVECLQATLSRLSETAENARVPCTAEFARQLRCTLEVACPDASLNDDALRTLEHCLTLLAWQLELIDPRTGQMLLDDSEQKELLDKFAHTCGLDAPVSESRPTGTLSAKQTDSGMHAE